jgi:tetratricopeptide (TPR) repeat protein
LDAHEENVLHARKELVRRLRRGETPQQMKVHEKLEEAFALRRSARILDLQTLLHAFSRLLQKSARVGERHRDIASRQAATVQLFMGIVAFQQAQIAEARKHWETGIRLSNSDAEIMKWLGELEAQQGNRNLALNHFEDALGHVGEDYELKAEILMLRAQIYNRSNNPLLEKNDLKDCGPNFEDARRWKEAAQAFKRLAELQADFGPYVSVQSSREAALRNYERAGDEAGAALMRQLLGTAERRQPPPPPIWPALLQWLRLSAELTVAFWAFTMLVS